MSLDDTIEIYCESNTFCQNKVKITVKEFKRKLGTNEYTLCEKCKELGYE